MSPLRFTTKTSRKPECCFVSKTVTCPNPALKFDVPLPSSEAALPQGSGHLQIKPQMGVLCLHLGTLRQNCEHPQISTAEGSLSLWTAAKTKGQ